MDFIGKSVISAKDFSRDELLHVIELARKFKETKTGYVGTGVHRSRLLDGKNVALLFLEPSSRTYFSFSTAAQSLGADAVYCPKEASYLANRGTLEDDFELGRTLEDTITMFLDLKSDAIVLRHPESYSAQSALDSVNYLAGLVNIPRIPVINAGDGTNEHPTQSLLDLYTMLEEKGTLDGLKIGIFGDLLNGRTVHSLSYALANFDVEVYFVSNQALQMPAERLSELDAMGLKYHQAPIEDLPKIMRRVDVGYATRIQKERFDSEEEYLSVKNLYCIDAKMMRGTKKDFILLHPGPVINEVADEVRERSSKWVYWRQIENGIYVRKALFSLVLGAVK